MRLVIVMTLLIGSIHNGQEQSLAPSNAVPATANGANPDSEGIYKGPGVTSPKVLRMVDPHMPEEARKKKLGGVCKVSLVVDAHGDIQDVHVVKSIADRSPDNLRSVALLLDDEAIKAVKQYRFSPALFGGKPVPTRLSVEVRFEIY